MDIERYDAKTIAQFYKGKALKSGFWKIPCPWCGGEDLTIADGHKYGLYTRCWLSDGVVNEECRPLDTKLAIASDLNTTIDLLGKYPGEWI